LYLRIPSGEQNSEAAWGLQKKQKPKISTENHGTRLQWGSPIVKEERVEQKLVGSPNVIGGMKRKGPKKGTDKKKPVVATSFNEPCKRVGMGGRPGLRN